MVWARSRGAGEGAIEALWRERERGGPFRDLFDLCQRVDLRKLNRRVLEALVRSGAFDALGANRATLMAQLPEALRLAEQHSRNDAAGQNDMFGLATAEETPTRPSYGAVLESADQPAVQPGCTTMPPTGCSGNHIQREWDEEERLRGEKETLGVYLTGHPINRLKSELEALGVTRLRDLNENGGGSRRGNERSLIVAGLVVSLRTRNANRGGRIAFVTLDDGGGRMELRIFPEVYEQHRSLIVEDAILLVQGSLGWDEFNQTTRLNVERVLDLDGARAERARRVQLCLNARQCAAGVLRELAGALAEHRADGRCAVWVEYVGSGARVELAFGSDWRVKPCEALLRRLRELAGAKAARLLYDQQPLTDRSAS